MPIISWVRYVAIVAATDQQSCPAPEAQPVFFFIGCSRFQKVIRILGHPEIPPWLEQSHPPSVGRLVETYSGQAEHFGSLAKAIEIKPGQSTDFGDIRFRVLKSYKVTGKLVPSSTFSDLEGFKIRLGLAAWKLMVATDSQGRFVLPNVPEGEHRLTAYLPFNLRTDRGVGHVSITVKDGDLENVQLPLDTLATYQVQIVDESGKPIPRIAAAAWWTADHSGVFTEGTESDEQGRATLYLYPAQRQYLGVHDWSGKYGLKSHQEVTPEKGAIVKSLTVTVLPGE